MLRYLLFVAAICFAAFGLSQANYTSRLNSTYGTSADERGGILEDRGLPFFAYERVYGTYSASMIVTKVNAEGAALWVRDLNGATPTRRYFPTQVVSFDGDIYVLGRRISSALAYTSVVYRIDGDTGVVKWSHVTSGSRIPDTMIIGTSVIIATHSLSMAYAERINIDTGALINEEVLSADGIVRGGRVHTTTDGSQRFTFWGRTGTKAAFWSASTFGSFTTIQSAVGSEIATWQGMSGTDRTLYGYSHNGNGTYRAITGHRATKDLLTFTVTPLDQITTSSGLKASFSYFSNILGDTDKDVAIYFGLSPSLVNRFDFDADGFPLRGTSIALGADPQTAFVDNSVDDVHAYVNVSGEAPRAIGVHPTRPTFLFTRAEEVITDFSYPYSIGTYEAATNSRNIVLRRLRLPCIPNAESVYHIRQKTQANYSAMNYYQIPINMFGEGNSSLVSGYTNGFTSVSISEYYEPNLNFIGTDMATYACGTPSVNGKVVIKVGLTPTVKEIRFRNLGEVIGGRTMQGKIVLTRPAEAGMNIPLTTNSTLISVPATVYVPAGQISATFTLSSQKVYAVATRNIVFGPGPEDVCPVKIISGGLNTFNIGPASVKGGQNATGSVSLTGPLPTYVSGATFAITANGGSVSFPPAVTLAPGGINKMFTITTNPVAQTVVRTFTLTQGVIQKTATLTITP